MMSAGPAPRVNPLQRLWLREIGIEKTWLRQDASSGSGKVSATRPANTQPAAAATPPQAVPAAPATRMPRPAIPGLAAAAGAAAAGAAAAAPREADPDRAARVSHADLETLRGMVSGCEACGLCRGRRQAVFGMGALAPRWMVVGEAPGEQEDRQGLPFVGRSGQLLDAMLAAVGMNRQDDVFIANVIKCRPPGNRNPTPEEIAACRPYLMRQIELLKPERILVLGRFAAQTLLDTDATIGSLRGRVHILRAGGRDIPLVVSYHPAYLLRSPSEKARSWQDLRLAARL
ncbi:uracil-DNA glycosylase family protein [Bordetella sp. FB-8]|uniref:uracil-DNA glycosylase n=1 Tax=Bordetella sp. FB-8 TaxID=1159870 RepID=UPI00037DED67|nr:uracil-DNA glycosylase [Bordetella sp. FB-8]